MFVFLFALHIFSLIHGISLLYSDMTRQKNTPMPNDAARRVGMGLPINWRGNEWQQCRHMAAAPSNHRHEQLHARWINEEAGGNNGDQDREKKMRGGENDDGTKITQKRERQGADEKMPTRKGKWQ
jgi:hypothetical protein